MKKGNAFLFLICLFMGIHLKAQHFDEIVFGNTQSELQHGFTGYDLSKTEVYTGLHGQTARRFLPNNNNPFQGQYTGIYGGEAQIVIKIDGTKQNYLTAKFSGSESSKERILLVVEGKEVGNRYHGDEDFFLGELYAPSPGVFCLRTLPIPRTLTDGKKHITIRLRSSGLFYGYGTAWNYATYQRAITTPTLGLYKIFSHTDPGFELPSEEFAGTAPSYADAAANMPENLTTFKDRMGTKANTYFNGLLTGSDFIRTDPNNYYHPVEALAHAYFVPEITATYNNPAVIEKVFKYLDNMVINNYNGLQVAGTSWGGAFGRQGFALSLLLNYFPQTLKDKLDEVVNLGGGEGKTRRQQWCETLKASFDFGASNRKTITNQVMECDASVYGAALGLFKLDSTTYHSYPTIGLRLAQEACGVEEFTGTVTNLVSGNPQLGTPANSNRGTGYFWMTRKGTSHEPGWVSTDCYGNLGGKMMEMYAMTVHHLGNNGDARILNMAIKHNKTQTKFTYPFIGSDGNKNMLAEGYICVRNTDIPGEEFYVNKYVAGISNDAELMGYVQQMQSDGRLKIPEANDFRFTSTQFLFKTIDNLLNGNFNTLVPTTPGQPDFVYADEENGIVSIKSGNEQLQLNFFYRDGGDNKMVRGHHITPKYQRFLEFKPLKTAFRPSGSVRVRNRRVNGFTDIYGNPPDDPESATNGQVEEYPSYDGTNKYNGNRLIKDYYFIRYGRYLVAMNTTGNTTKTIEFPPELIGKAAKNLNTGTEAPLPTTMELPGVSTYVFLLNESTATPGLAEDNTNYGSINKDSLQVAVAEKEAFARDTATIQNIALISSIGKYKSELFLSFMNALSFATYMRENTRITQQEVDSAVVRLKKAYDTLVNGTYRYVVNPVPGIVDFYNKKLATGGSIVVQAGGIGSTRNNAYIVIPVQATQTGNYVVTIKASTTRPQSVQPRLNMALLNDGTNYTAYTPNATNSKLLRTESSWATMSEYKWNVTLSENDIRLLRITFLVTDGGWCANISEIKFAMATSWDMLQSEIQVASALLAEYSVITLPKYSKVTDADRNALQQAIALALSIPSNETEDAISETRTDLANAVSIFKNAISPISMVAGYFDFPLYSSKSGTITVNTNDIGSTRNNAYVVYKFRARKSAYYIPGINASTNTEITQNPRVNLFIGTDSLMVTNSTDINSNSVNIIKGPAGWNSYSTYQFRSLYLDEGIDYFVKMSYYTAGTWAANLNAFYMKLDSSYTASALPVVVSDSVSTIINDTFHYQISATNNTYRYKATNLPAGLIVNEVSGEISGTPVVAGAYNIPITAINAKGSTLAQLHINVLKKTQTVILAPVTSKRIDDASFQITATASTGLPLTYSSADTSIVSISSEGQVTIRGIGTTHITALQAGNDTYYPASDSQTITIIGYNLQVYHKDGDNGKTTNNSIRPHLKLFNNDSVPVSYRDITARYWITPENYSGINSWIDYAQIGNKITATYIPVPNPRNGAFGYMEYRFDSTAGILAAGSNSGVIESRLANTNWSILKEEDDYSFAFNSTYTLTSKVTLYHKGVLVWGTEPVEASPVLSVKANTKSYNTNTNTISIGLNLENNGNKSLNYADVSIRYWFSSEGSQPLLYWTDYAQLGSNHITGAFVRIDPPTTTADAFLELKIDSTAGSLYPLSNTGNIQFRITKSDWSVFNQANDHSYMNVNSFQENNMVTVYYKGELIWGSEPAQTYSARAGQSSLLSYIPNASAATIYPNPAGEVFYFRPEMNVNTKPMNLQLKLMDNSGRIVYEKIISEYSGGAIEIRPTVRLTPGIYWLHSGKTRTFKIVIN